MPRDPKNFTGENMKGLLEASYRDERLREGNKLVGHFGITAILAVVVVVAVVVAVFQIFLR